MGCLSVREKDFIKWICSQSEFDAAKVPLGPGDDCAMLACGAERVLVTTDQVLDGVHFVLERHGAKAAGRKSMARNLSDVAAMAGLPTGAVATVALPEGFSRDSCEAIYLGLRSMGDQFDCPVVGGDVACWAGPLAISVTVFAQPAGVGPVLRSGAKVGDAICVTGQLGGAWASGRDMTFTPRINEARTLAAHSGLHAMIDLSDGLATDLRHICEASQVGAEIDAGAIPIHPDLTDKPQRPAISAALGDGEDYELLFTLPPDHADRLLATQPLDVKITKIGTVNDSKDVTLLGPDGQRHRLEPSGWEHATGQS